MNKTPKISKAFENARAEWRFAHYPPGARMPEHRHELAHFSLTLSGAHRETSRGAGIEMSGLEMAFKPRNFRHANEFGPQGASLLSINLRDADDDDQETSSSDWRVRPALGVLPAWMALVRTLKAPDPDADEIDDLTDDILTSLLADEEARLSRTPPAWLKRAKESLMEAPQTTDRIARDAAVHRVHLSRAYKAYFGVTISEDRRRARVARAVREILSGDVSLAAAALAAGFSDQPHMTREVKSAVGMTPKELSRLVRRGDVTFIQERR